jgi:hypothetical protein
MTGTSTARTQGLVGDFAFKAPVRAASVAALVLSGLQTVDGVALAEFDRVLVKNQADNTQNGIYEVHATAWLRTPDCAGPYNLTDGSLVLVRAGTVNAALIYQASLTPPFVAGTSPLTWPQQAVSQGKAGINGSPFKGALAYLTGDKTLSGPDLNVPWDAVDYDTDTCWLIANPTRLVVPAGATFVRLAGTFKVQSAVATTDGGITFRKNGTTFRGYSGHLTKIALENWFLTVVSPVVAAVAGDYFEMVISMDSGTVKSGIESSFSLEVVK